MIIVDSHCHIGANWYEPIETLLHHMDRNGVGQAILVQMLGQLDNRYQQSCLQRHRDRLASIVAVDPNSPGAIQLLEQLASEGASGVRLRPTARSPGDDPLAVWRVAEQHGLAVSCIGTSATFTAREFREVIEAVPDLKIVLEHLGGTSRADATDADRHERLRAFELAKYPNVYLKVPGLGELIPRPPQLPALDKPWSGDVPLVLAAALKSFGCTRLMWGSDFPVVCSREGYQHALSWCQDALSAQAPDALRWIFGETARHVFTLPSL